MSTKTAKPTNTPPPLPPDKLAEELMGLAEDASDYDLERAVDEAQKKLDLAKARLARAGEKQLRILRARSIDEAKAILEENEADQNLKKLCQQATGWKPLQEGGATDQQIRVVLLKGWPDRRGQDKNYDDKFPGCEAGWLSYGLRAGEADDRRTPKAWVDPDKPKSSLGGAQLYAAVRRVMNIPQPKKPPPPAKPAAAAAAKGKPKPTTPAKKKSAIKSQKPVQAKPKEPATAPAQTKAQAKDASARSARTMDKAPGGAVKQTFGQWAATLRAIPDGVDLHPMLPALPNPTEQERFFLDQYAKGAGPAAARDAWKKRDKPAPIADVARFVQKGQKAQAAVDEAIVRAKAPEEMWAEDDTLADLSKLWTPDGLAEGRAKGVYVALDGTRWVTVAFAAKGKKVNSAIVWPVVPTNEWRGYTRGNGSLTKKELQDWRFARLMLETPQGTRYVMTEGPALRVVAEAFAKGPDKTPQFDAPVQLPKAADREKEPAALRQYVDTLPAPGLVAYAWRVWNHLAHGAPEPEASALPTSGPDQAGRIKVRIADILAVERKQQQQPAAHAALGVA